MFANKIGESSSTTGTGTFALAGATGAYRTWRTGFSTNTTVFYMASNATGTIWEIGYGTFATGSPDTLTRNLLQSSTGSLINWVTTPYYIFSIPAAEALAAVVNGGLGTSRPAWAPAGFSWWDDAAGIAVNWIRKLYNGTADVRIGLYDAVKGLYFPDGRRPTTAVGAANKTVAAADIAGCFTYSTTAAARTITLPAGSTLKDGFETEHLGLDTAFGLIFTPDAGDAIDYGAAGATKTVIGQVPVKIRWDSAASKWRTNYVAAAAGTGQLVSTVTGAVATGSTALPYDDTVPQNTEGDQYMSLAITPASATSKLIIDVVFNFAETANDIVSAALFQDSTAGALAAASMYWASNNLPSQIAFRYVMTSGTTSATTFKVRAGRNSSGTVTFNGAAAGRIFGAVMASSITIREVLP